MQNNSRILGLLVGKVGSTEEPIEAYDNSLNRCILNAGTKILVLEENGYDLTMLSCGAVVYCSSEDIDKLRFEF